VTLNVGLLSLVLIGPMVALHHEGIPSTGLGQLRGDSGDNGEFAANAAVVLHLPMPHPPFFYNAATASFDSGSTPIFAIWKQNQRGYLDTGIGDGTTLIFTADHP
jgi:hypothetical protein